jgi:hypothetical protein
MAEAEQRGIERGRILGQTEASRAVVKRAEQAIASGKVSRTEVVEALVGREAANAMLPKGRAERKPTGPGHARGRADAGRSAAPAPRPAPQPPRPKRATKAPEPGVVITILSGPDNGTTGRLVR